MVWNLKGIGLFLTVFLVLGSCRGYEATSGDAEILEIIETKIAKRVENNALSLAIFQVKVEDVLGTLSGESRSYYLVNELNSILNEALDAAALSGSWSSSDTGHRFTGVSITEIDAKEDDEDLTITAGEKLPLISVMLENDTSTALTEYVTIVCGKEGFRLFRLTKTTLTRIDIGGSAEYAAVREPLSDDLNATTGDVTIECRVYDAHGTKEYIATTATLTVEDDSQAPVSTLDIVFKDIKRAAAHNASGDYLMYFQNISDTVFSGTLSVACHEESERDEDDFEATYASYEDVVINSHKTAIRERSGDYERGTDLECRLQPGSIEGDNNTSNDTATIITI